MSQERGPGGEDSLWLRILTAFLDERTIRWLLGVGIALVLAGVGSLVAKNWDFFEDNPGLQYLLLLVLTGGLSGTGWLARTQAGLPRTAVAFDLLALGTVPLNLASLAALHLLDAPRSLGDRASLGLVAVSLPALWWAAARALRALVGGAPARLVGALIACSLGAAVLTDWRLLTGAAGQLAIVLGTGLALAWGLAQAHLELVVDRGRGGAAPVLLGTALATLALVVALRMPGVQVGGLAVVLGGWLAVQSAAAMATVRPPRGLGDAPALTALGGYLASFVGLSLAFGGVWLGNGVLGVGLALAIALYASSWIVLGRPAFLHLAVGALVLEVMLAGYIDPGVHATLRAAFARLLGEGTNFAAVPLVLVVVILERAMGLARGGLERGQLGASATLLSIVSILLAAGDPRGRVVMLGFWAVAHAVGAFLHLEKDLLVLAGLELALAAGAAVAYPGVPPALTVAALAAGLAVGLLALALALRGGATARMSSFVGWDRLLPVHPLSVAALAILAVGGAAALRGLDARNVLPAALPLVVQGTTLLALWRHHRRKLGEDAGAPAWLDALALAGLVWHGAASLMLAAPLLGRSLVALPVKQLVGLAAVGALLLRGRWVLDRAGGRPRLALGEVRFDPLAASGNLYLVLALALAAWDGREAARWTAPLVLAAYVPELFVREAARTVLYPVIIAAEAAVVLWLPPAMRAQAMQVAAAVWLAVALGAGGWLRQRYAAWPGAAAERLLPPLEVALLHLPLAWTAEPALGVPWAVGALLVAAREYRTALPLHAAELLALAASATVLRSGSGWLADGARLGLMAMFLLHPDPGGSAKITGHLVAALQVVAAVGLGTRGVGLAAMLAAAYAALHAAADRERRESGWLAAASMQALFLAGGLAASEVPLRSAAVAGAAALAMALITAWPACATVALADAALTIVLCLAAWPPVLQHYSLGPECGQLALALGLAGAAQLVALSRRPAGWLAWSGVLTTAAGLGMLGKWISTGGPPGMWIGAAAALGLAVAAPRLAGLEPWALTRIPVLLVSVGAALSSVGRMIKLAGPDAPPQFADHLLRNVDRIFMLSGVWSRPMGVGLALLAATAVAWELAGIAAAGWLAVVPVLVAFHGGLMMWLPESAQPAALAALCVGAALAGRLPAGEGARAIAGRVARGAGDTGRVALTAMLISNLVFYWMGELTGDNAELLMAPAFLLLALGDFLTLRQGPGRTSGPLGIAAASGLVWCVALAVRQTPEDAALALAWTATAFALARPGAVRCACHDVPQEVVAGARTRHGPRCALERASRWFPEAEAPAWLDGWLPPVRMLSGVATGAALGAVVASVTKLQDLEPSHLMAARLALAGAVPLALAWVRSSFLRECVGLTAITLAMVEVAAKVAGGHGALIGSAWLPAALLITYFTYRGIGHALEGAPDYIPVPPRSWLTAGRAAAALGGPAVLLALFAWPFPDDARGLARTAVLLAMELAFLRSRRRSTVGDSWVSQSVPMLELALLLLQADRVLFWSGGVHPPHFWPVLAAVLAAVGWVLDALAQVERPALVRETVAPAVLADWARVYRVTATAALLPCLAGSLHPGLRITLDLAATAVLLPVLGRGLPAVWPLATLAIVLLVPVHAALSVLDLAGRAPAQDQLAGAAPWLATYLALAAEVLAFSWQRSRLRGAMALWLAPERIAPLVAAVRDGAMALALVPLYGIVEPGAAGAGAMAAGAALLAALAIRTGSLNAGTAAVVATALTAHRAALLALAGDTQFACAAIVLLNLALGLLWKRVGRRMEQFLPGAPFPFHAAAVLHPWLAWGAATLDVVLAAGMADEQAAARLSIAIGGLLLARLRTNDVAADLSLALALAVGAARADGPALRDAWFAWARDPGLAHTRFLLGQVIARGLAFGLATRLAARGLGGTVLPRVSPAALLGAAALAVPLSLCVLDGTPRGTAWLALALAAPIAYLLTGGQGRAAAWFKRLLPVQVGLLGVQAALAAAGADPVGRLIAYPGLAAVALVLAVACEAVAASGATIVDRPALAFAVRAWELVALAGALAPLALTAALAVVRGGPWLPTSGALVLSGLLELALVRRAAGRVESEPVALATIATLSLVLAALQAVAQVAGVPDVFSLVLRAWGPAAVGAVLLAAAAGLRAEPARRALALPGEVAAALTRGFAGAAGLSAAGTLAYATSSEPAALAGFLLALPVELGALALGGFPWLVSPAILLAAGAQHGLWRVVVGADPVQAFLVWPLAAVEALALAAAVRRLAPAGVKRLSLDEGVLDAWTALLETVAGGLATASLALALLAACDGPAAGARVAGPPAAALAVFLWLRAQSRRPRTHAGVWAAALVLVAVVDLDLARAGSLLGHLVLSPHGALILVAGSLLVKAIERLFPDPAAEEALAGFAALVPSLTAALTLTGALDVLVPGPDGGLRPEAPGRLVLLAAALTGQLLARPRGGPAQPAAEGLALVYLLAAADGALWRLLARGPLLVGDRLIALAALSGALGLVLRRLAVIDGPWSRVFARASLARIGRYSLHAGALVASLAPALPGPLSVCTLRTALAALMLVGDGLVLGSPVWGIGGVVLGLVAVHLIAWTTVASPEWPVWALLELGLAHGLLALRPRSEGPALRALPPQALERLSTALVVASQVLCANGLALALEHLGQPVATWPLVAWLAHALLIARTAAPIGGELLVVAAGTALSVQLHLLLGIERAPALRAVLHAAVLSAVWSAAARAVDAQRKSVRQGAADLCAGAASWMSLALLDPREPGLTARLSVAAAVQVADLLRGRRDRFDRTLWEHLSLACAGGALISGIWGVTGRWFELGMAVALVGLSRAYDLLSDAASSPGLVARAWSSAALDRAGFVAAQASAVTIGAVFLHYPQLTFDASAQVAVATALAIALLRGHERASVGWLSLVAVQATAIHIVFVALSELGFGGWPQLALEPAAAAVLMLGHAVLVALDARAAQDAERVAAGAAPRRQLLPPAVLEVAVPLWEMLVAVTVGFGVFGAIAHLGQSATTHDVLTAEHIARLALLAAVARAMGLRQTQGRSGLPGGTWDHAALALTVALVHVLPALRWTVSELLEGLLTPAGALAELVLVLALAPRGPARGAFPAPVLAVWQELWACAAGLVALAGIELIFEGPRVDPGGLLLHATALFGLRVVVPTLAQDAFLLAGAGAAWVALGQLGAGFPPGFWPAGVPSPVPAAAMLEVAAVLALLGALFARTAPRETALLPQSRGRACQAAAGVLLWLVPAALVRPSAYAYWSHVEPDRQLAALIALHLPGLWWMRRHAADGGTLATIWRRAAQVSFLACFLPLYTHVVFRLGYLLQDRFGTMELAGWGWSLALPMFAVLALCEAPSLVELVVDRVVLRSVAEIGLALGAFVAAGSCLEFDRAPAAAFGAVALLHAAILLATRRALWQVTAPSLATAMFLSAVYHRMHGVALVDWPLYALVLALAAEVVEVAGRVTLRERPLVGALTGYLLAGAYRGAALLLCMGVWIGITKYWRSWPAGALFAALLSLRARSSAGARAAAATSLALAGATAALALGRVLWPEGQDFEVVLRWPALALLGAIAGEAMDAAARALAARAPANGVRAPFAFRDPTRPSAALVWGRMFSEATPLARAVAVAGALGTLAVNIAAGPSPASALRLLALSLVLAPMRRWVAFVDASVATPLVASLALYWAMLAGLTWDEVSNDPWYTLVRFELATAGLGLAWRAIARACDRMPDHPFLPVPEACRRAGDWALAVAAVLAALAIAPGLAGALGQMPAPPAYEVVGLAVSLIALVRSRSGDDLNGLASGTTLAHATLLAWFGLLAVPSLRPYLGVQKPLVAALALAASALYATLPAAWFGEIPATFAGAARALGLAASAFAFVAHVAWLTPAAAANALAAVFLLAAGCAVPGAVPAGARAIWPALLALSSGQFAAMALAYLHPGRSFIEHLFVTPLLALLLVGWRVAFRHAAVTDLPAWLAARVDRDALGAVARHSDRLLFPLALVPLTAALEAGALTAARLALSVLIQAVVFRERRSDHRRLALAVTLGLAAVHVPLAVLGHHGGLTASALPRIAASLLAGALVLELARALMQRFEEPELADLTGLVALVSAGLALPAVATSVAFGTDLTAWNATSLALTCAYYMWQGAARKNEAFVYVGEIAGASLYAYLRVTGIVRHTQWNGLIAVALNFAIYGLARQAARLELATFERPLRYSSYVLPLVVVGFELRTFMDHPWTAIQTLLAMGAFYTTAVLDGSWRNLQYVAALCYNAALFLAWSTVNPQGLQGYLTCVGVTVLWIVHANRDVFSGRLQASLRTVATILLVIGPVGEWIQHTSDATRLMELAGTAAIVGLAGVVLRIRVLLYTGTLTFGLALAGSAYHLTRVSVGVRTLVLLGAGGGVIALAALFEKQRERILGRIRQIQGELAEWD